MGYLAAEERPHIIITLHGIRTYGSWQERLEKLVRPGRESSPPWLAARRRHEPSVPAAIIQMSRLVFMIAAPRCIMGVATAPLARPSP